MLLDTARIEGEFVFFIVFYWGAGGGGGGPPSKSGAFAGNFVAKRSRFGAADRDAARSAPRTALRREMKEKNTNGINAHSASFLRHARSGNRHACIQSSLGGMPVACKKNLPG